MSWLRRKSEAREELQRAEQELAETRANTPRVQALAESLRELRERNHFGESIAHTFRGGKP